MNRNIVPFANKIIVMIEQARQKALQSVNAELIKLYWSVGEYLSAESKNQNGARLLLMQPLSILIKTAPE